MSYLDLTTALGNFRILLMASEAPETCRYFINAVRNGALREGSIFRIVSSKEHNENENSPIDVVQIGARAGLAEKRSLITHEHSGTTGLLHENWTVSAARFAPGEVYNSFFVCMRKEPTLDFGGSRHEDGQGFAAFGKVISGFDVVKKAYQKAEQETCLREPIAVTRIEYCYEATDRIA